MDELFNHFYLVLIVVSFGLLIILLILNKNKKQKQKKQSAKQKYIDLMNDLLNLSYLKEYAGNNILLSKLNQLKEIIAMVDFQISSDDKLDLEIQHLIEELYLIIYTSPKLNLNVLYTDIENIIQLINKKRVLLKPKKHKR